MKKYIVIISLMLSGINNSFATGGESKNPKFDPSDCKCVNFNAFWNGVRNRNVTLYGGNKGLKSSVNTIILDPSQTEDKKVSALSQQFKQAVCSDWIAYNQLLFHHPEYKHKVDAAVSRKRWATILGFALAENQPDLVELIFKKEHSNLNSNIQNITIKHYDPKDNEPAVIAAPPSMWNLFKKYKANFNVELPEKYGGGTLLHLHLNGETKNLQWLLKNTDVDPNQKDNNGDTVAHTLTINCGWVTQKSENINSQRFNALKDYINPLITNNQGKTPAQQAKEYAKNHLQKRDFDAFAQCKQMAKMFRNLEKKISRKQKEK